MWARAIIFGIELVGFAIFCIVVTVKEYKQDLYKGSEMKWEDVISNLRFNIIYFIINYVVILSLFVFSYPSYVFLSYSKLILLSVSILVSVAILLFFTNKNSLEHTTREFICIMIGFFSVIYFLFAIIGIAGVEKKIVVSEQTDTQKIIPVMFSKNNQIGYTADLEGNIKTYVFYYQGNNGVWEYEEVKASETKVEKIKDTNTYIERTMKSTSYCKRETF